MSEYTIDIDGHEVVEHKMRVTKAGDGLSEAMQLDDEELHVGSEVTLVLRGIVTRPRFNPVDAKDPDGDYVRIDTIEAVSATLVADDTVTKIMDEHTERVAEMRAKAKEAKQGIKRIPFEGTAVDAAQHAEDGVDNVSTIRS